MKIEIYFLNQKLTTEVIKDITVKELLNDLKQYLNTKDSNFSLFDNNFAQLKESDIISTGIKEKKLTFYLIKSSPNKKNLEKNENIKEKSNLCQLLMKCTGAKNALDLKKINNQNIRFNVIDLFNNNEQNGENNAFDRLFNLLQILENNGPIGLRVGQMNNNNNNNQIEADEQSLRELQDMGFPEDRAREALINSRNDINRATEILLGDAGE